MIQLYEYKTNCFYEYDADKPISLCLGFFDGLHLGHLGLIEAALKEKEPVGVLTFEGALKEMTSRRANGNMLTSVDDRKDMLDRLGVRYLFVCEFTRNLMNMSPDDFITQILRPLNIKRIFVGPDFSFGRKAEGKISDLRKYFEVSVIGFICSEENGKSVRISSSLISSLIARGRISDANNLLGRPYAVKGTIIRGLGNGGAVLGYPTANLSLAFPYVLPSDGTYASCMTIGGRRYLGMTYIGTHPTIDQLKNPAIETNLFGFSGNAYGLKAKLEFLGFLRPDEKFADLPSLSKQMGEDKKRVMAEFGGSFR